MAKSKILETAFDRYTLSTLLGEGGAGRVYAATTSQGDQVAVKLLTPELATSHRRKRFQNEIEFCRRARHDHVIRILDVGADLEAGKSVPYYVMPRFAGTLRQILAQKQEPDRLLRYFTQMLDGVEAAHLLGAIHRDLKPENFLYDQSSDRLVVADFGIAHFAEEFLVAPIETVPAERLANFVYSAPEQRRKGAAVDQRADLFALGLMLSEMFTGSVPHGASYRRIVETHANLAYLDGLVDELIQQDPMTRPGSIEAVKQQLVGRLNQFIAFQELRQKQMEVAATTEPAKFEPVSIREVDWNQNRLTIFLNRAPEAGFITRFLQPKHTMHTYGRFHHRSFVFTSDKAYVNDVQDQQVQGVIDLFKKHLGPAHAEYLEDLHDQAVRQDRELREKLRAETARAAQRAAVLAKIRL